MSYGSNASSGLNAIRTVTESTWNGGTASYLVNSGYNQNIWKNDPLVISGGNTNNSLPGYVISLYDIGQAAFQTNYVAYQASSILGVSAGLEYQVPASLVPVDPANPGRPVWIAGTQTVGGVPAVINVINDPSVIYDIQTSGDTGVGATQANVGTYASLSFSVANGLVQGNSQLGTSVVTLNLANSIRTLLPRGANQGSVPLNCYINAISSYPTNTPGQIYNNVEVIIANHYFRQMPSLTVAS